MCGFDGIHTMSFSRLFSFGVGSYIEPMHNLMRHYKLNRNKKRGQGGVNFIIFNYFELLLLK